MTLTFTLLLTGGCLKFSKDDSSSRIPASDKPLIFVKKKNVLNLVRTRDIKLSSLKSKYPSMKHVYIYDENKRNSIKLNASNINDETIFKMNIARKNMKITAKITMKDNSVVYERL